jgi:hypothetical protein
MNLTNVDVKVDAVVFNRDTLWSKVDETHWVKRGTAVSVTQAEMANKLKAISRNPKNRVWVDQNTANVIVPTNKVNKNKPYRTEQTINITSDYNAAVGVLFT